MKMQKSMACLTVMLSVALVSISSRGASIVKKKLVGSELIDASKPSDWRTPDPENLLYFEIPAGRVIIELAPDYAPEHVKRIKQLARQKYWDDLAIVRVQDNYVVQWADPNSEKPDLKRKFTGSEEVLPSELDVELKNNKARFDQLPEKDVYAAQVGFTNGMAVGRDKKAGRTWLLHCYGAVGVGRDVKPDSGDGTELYAVIGHAPRHLDRNVTVVGRILRGHELLSSLPRGHAAMGFYDPKRAEKTVPIRSVRVATDVPEDDRTGIEVLRTDTQLFKQLIQAKQNRAEEWFHYRAGHVDICNMIVPVREKVKP
jgi:peptidylprolyl isomerase